MTGYFSTSRAGRYPYYMCFTKGCDRNRKSIARAKVEDAFAALLERLTPSEQLWKLAAAMFKDAWDLRLAQSKAIEASYVSGPAK